MASHDSNPSASPARSPRLALGEAVPEPASPPTPLRVPRLSLAEAIRRHWIIALLPVIVLVGIGVALALMRTPVYSAQTRMQVGNFDLSQPGALSAFTAGSETLATSFSRAVDGEAVVRPVAKALGTSPEVVRRQISATPVPKSPEFSVVAKTDSPASSVRLSRLAARHLQRYVVKLNRPIDRRGELYRAYRRAALEYSAAVNRQAHLDRDDGAAFVEAEAEARAANTRLSALRNSYLKSVDAQNLTPAEAEILSRPNAATSDRNQVLQLYLFIGLVAGVLAGTALAALVASATVRRSLSTS